MTTSPSYQNDYIDDEMTTACANLICRTNNDIDQENHHSSKNKNKKTIQWLITTIAVGLIGIIYFTSSVSTTSTSVAYLAGEEKGQDVQEQQEGRVFLHIADTHADPYYNYEHYFEPADKIVRDPNLYSKGKIPSKECGLYSESVESLVGHWKETENPGQTCPCGHYGANPPYAVLESLVYEIQKQEPEFILWGGDFTSHYEPGMAIGDTCRTAKISAMSTVTILGNAATAKPIQNLFVWGNNDVIPKKQPLDQDWLEEFGTHLVQENWLCQEEYNTTWIRGGYYRRNLGDGLCVINLNSNSWTVGQINKVHHNNQLVWLQNNAFHDDPSCKEYLVNAHVPIGWLESGKGHHVWTNLQKAVAHEYCDMYRHVLDRHHLKIIAELYGHINKADVRLMGKGVTRAEDDENNEVDGTEEEDGIFDSEEDIETNFGKDPVSMSSKGDVIGDLDENIGQDAQIVSFTVAGISRRGNNDPQFQRIILEPDPLKKGIQDIDVYSMKGNDCGKHGFTFAYSFRDLFTPDFDNGINVQSVLDFVNNDKEQKERIEKYLALSSMIYTKKDLKSESFIDRVRNDQTGCERI